jgi:hypothetical protein
MGRLQEYLCPRFKESRFDSIRPWQGRLILACFLLFILLGFLCCYISPPKEKKKPRTSRGDARVYRNIVQRVHDGENYYTVVGDELRTNDYATKPFFNWKLPLLTLFLANLPTVGSGRWILVLLTLIMLIYWVRLFIDEANFRAALLVVFLLSATVVGSLSDWGYFFHEIWAGVFIALSIVLYARNRPLSIALGLSALFIRELSLPFVIVMLFLAYINGNRREAAVWLVGIFVFFIYLGIHGWIVSGLLTNSDRSNATWIQFGGLSFVFATTKWNIISFFSPCWINAIIFPAALLGLLHWKSAVGDRVALTVLSYVFAFLFVGRPDNNYWGFMYAPLLPLGLLHTARSVFELWSVSVGRRK